MPSRDIDPECAARAVAFPARVDEHEPAPCLHILLHGSDAVAGVRVPRRVLRARTRDGRDDVVRAGRAFVISGVGLGARRRRCVRRVRRAGLGGHGGDADGGGKRIHVRVHGRAGRAGRV